jgi:hypothetical protein
MDYTLEEMEIALKLKQMKKDKRYTALSLHPAAGYSTIEARGNTMYINEGRDGKWAGISERFYDEMVNLYDSRN